MCKMSNQAHEFISAAVRVPAMSTALPPGNDVHNDGVRDRVLQAPLPDESHVKFRARGGAVTSVAAAVTSVASLSFRSLG